MHQMLFQDIPYLHDPEKSHGSHYEYKSKKEMMHILSLCVLNVNRAQSQVNTALQLIELQNSK